MMQLEGNPAMNTKLSNIFKGIRAALWGVYGTDDHIEHRERVDHACRQIIRMAEEADKVTEGHKQTAETIDEALRAIARDM